MIVRPMIHQDIEESAVLHLRAFKGYMNASLGKNYVRKFLSWFINNNIATAWVAEDNNKILGYIIGAAIGYDSLLNKALLSTGIWSILTHPRILFHPKFQKTIQSRVKLLIGKQRAKVEVEPINQPLGRGISLVGIAVDPNSGNKGCGTKLMQVFEEKAKESGYNYMSLSVYNENKKARHLYAKNGWDVLAINGPVLRYYKQI